MRSKLHNWDQSGATDGQVAQWDAALGEWVPVDPPVTGIQSIVAGARVAVDDTAPANVIVSALAPLTTVVGGVPDLVWDADNNLVFTEAPE
jgi:hypothetical protein